MISKGVLSTITFPDESWAAVYGISDSGVISGSYWDSAIVLHGFIGIPQ